MLCIRSQARHCDYSTCLYNKLFGTHDKINKFTRYHSGSDQNDSESSEEEVEEEVEVTATESEEEEGNNENKQNSESVKQGKIMEIGENKFL